MPETPANSSRVGTFDGRYHYDHIYPRGRSGETLRAWDPQKDNLPVVIKRPAPQDAPPMRAAQQVSIRSERRALERLSGHPVLTELRGVGSFRIGGQSHDYIVMERATGAIIEDVVLEYAEHGERLPLLEMLVIIDELLDLLVLAHDQQVVYNDVDAKHLFWNRDTYRLKVIDWGNAVLLDESNTNNVTRQTDVLQVGELLYFIVTGGKRLDAESTPEGDYAVIFGLDAPTAPSMLQTIITNATHPSLRKRYTTIVELRQQLSELRRPLEERRDAMLRDVQQKLIQRNSPQELEELFTRLDEAAAMDPGFPQIKTLRAEVQVQLQRLRVQSDIDAARIYLDTANWARVIETMLDLLNTADDQTAPIIRFIVSAAELLDFYGNDAPPPELATAIDALQSGEYQQAALVLHNSDETLNQLLADRLAMYMPGVLLLRPALTRLRVEAKALSVDASVIQSIDVMRNWLQAPDDTVLSLSYIRHQYQAVETALNDLQAGLSSENAERLSDVMRRALQATQTIAQHLATINRLAFSEPERAAYAIQQAQQVDPLNPALTDLHGYIEEIHLTIEAISGFKPDVNGSNLESWFDRVLNILTTYADDIEDPQLRATHSTLQNTADSWQQVCDAFIMGQRSIAKALLIRAARQIGELNPRLSQWLRDLSEEARTREQLEQLSPNGELSAKILEAQRLWDAGKYRDAAYQMEGAFAIAKSEGELQAVKRLSELSLLPANWLEHQGPQDSDLTSRTEKALVALFLPEEQKELDDFTGVTRSEGAYLKTMNRALLDPLYQNSSLAVRILFMHYTLQGMLCVQERDLHGADFWRQVALQAFSDGRTTPVFAAFDHHLSARKLIERVESALAEIHHVDQLDTVRTMLNSPIAEEWLRETNSGVRQLSAAVKHWEDGEFRSARETFDTALEALEAGQETSGFTIEKLLNWVRSLRDSVAELQASRLKVEEISHSTRIPAPGEYVAPDPLVEQTLMNIVVTTEQYIGEAHAHQVRQWHSTYLAVQHTYTKALPKAEKLSEFQTHFANLFINRHPTFRLYQIWREVTQNLPDTSAATPPQPILNTSASAAATVVEGEFEPQPSMRAGDATTASVSETQASSREQHAMPAQQIEEDPTNAPGFVDEDGQSLRGVTFADDVVESNIPWVIIGTVVVVIIGVIAFALLGGIGDGGEDDDTSSTGGNTGNAAAVLSTNTPISTDLPLATDTVAPIATDAPTETSEPAVVPTDTDVPPPTDTQLPTETENPPTTTPTNTPEPSATQTSSPTPVPTNTPSATPTDEIAATSPLSTDGLLSIDVLDALNQPDAGDFSWNPLWFYPGVNGPWTLGPDEGRAQGGPVVIRFTESDLIALTGLEDAPARLQTIEMVMSLAVPVASDPSSAEDIGSGLYFGLGVENDARERVSVEVRVPRPSSMAWGVRENDNYREVTSFPESNFEVVLRLERNTDGTISLLVENQGLGTSEANYRSDTPLLPVIYTSRGGVYIVITSMVMEFAPVQ